MSSKNNAKAKKAVGASLGEVMAKSSAERELQLLEAEKAREQKKDKKAKKENSQKEARLLAAEKYQELKKKVLAREKENYSEIILLQEKERPGEKKKRWWNVFGHSAYILKYNIGKTHDLTFRIHEDDDYGENKSKGGVIRIPNLENFLSLMKRKGYEEVRKGKECVTISLKEELTVEQYQALIEVNEHLERHLNSLIRPRYMLQELNSAICEFDKRLHEMARKMDAQSQAVYGNDMEKLSIALKIKLLRVARGSYPLEQYLEEATDKVEEIWGYISVVMSRRSFAFEKVAEVGDALLALEEQIEKEKMALKRKKENASNTKAR